MKLNYRDKIILGALLAFVILLAGFFLLIKPKYTDIKDDKATLAEVEKERDEVDAKIAEIKPLQTEIKATYDETKKLTDDFVEYNSIYTSRKVDQYMQHFAEECEVKVLTIQAKDPSTSNIDYYYFKPSFVGEDMLLKSDLNGDIKASLESDKAESTALAARTKESVITATYTVNVQGEKENIWKYLQAIEDQKETIIIDSVTLNNVIISEEAAKKAADAAAAEGKEADVAKAQIVISLYSVYDLPEPNLEAD